MYVYYGLTFSEIRRLWLRQIVPFAGLSLLGAALIGLVFGQARRSEAARAAAEVDAERARVELEGAAALRASEERYRLLVEQADDGIFVADASGRYIDVNPAGCRMLGYSRDEIRTRAIADVISPEEVARIAPEVARFAGGAMARSEWRFRRKDGSGFIGEVVGRQLDDGRLQAIVRDITDRKDVEERLRVAARQAEELALTRLRLSSIVDSTDDAVMSFDVEGRTTSWNKGAERLFGFTEQEAFARDAGLLVAPLGSVLPGEGPRGAFEQALSGEKFQRDTIRVAKDGTIIDVNVTASQLRAPDGRVIGVSAIMRDIRDRKRAEQELRARELLLRTATGSAAVGLVMLDRQRRYTFVNAPYIRILGLSSTPEALLGKSPSEVLASVYATQISPRLDLAFARQRVTYELSRDARHYTVVYDPVVEDGGEVGAVIVTIFDITERKLAEEAVRESIARYELVMAGSEAAIWDWDVPRRKVAYSPRWKKLHGFAENEIGDGEEIWSESIHPDDKPRVMAAVAAHFEGRTPYFAEEYRILRKDGSWLWVSDRGLAQRDADGRVVRMAGSETDITARRISEEKLRESRQSLQAALDIASVAPWGWDEVRQVKLWTGSTKAIFGLPPEAEMTRELFVSLLHPDDVPRYHEAWSAALDPDGPGRYELQYRIRRADDGAERWITSRATVEFEDRRAMRVVGALRDFTGEKLAEEALRESERRFRQVAESLPQLVWTCRPDGSCDYLSPQWVSYTGKPEAEQLGFDWLEQLHPDDRQPTIESWNSTSKRGENFAAEFRIRHHDGAYRWFRALAVPLRDASGTIVKWFGSNTDIDDIRQAQDALRESEERLRLTNEAAGIGTFVIDVAAGTARYSPELAEMLGVPGVTLTTLGLAFARIHHDDVDRVGKLYKVAHDPSGDGRLRMEFRFVRPGGEVRWLTWNGKVEFRDTPSGRVPNRVLGACVDITERKRGEQQLAASEERLRAIVDTAVDAIIVSDEQGVIQSVNPAAEQMFACPAADLAGTSVSSLIAGPDRAAHDGYLGSYLRSGEARIIGRGRREVIALRRGGATFQADLAVVEWFASGKRYFTGILRDITERKRSERQIKNLLAEVNHRAKNLLGVVQAIAMQTAASDPADFIERFSDRIQGLAASQDLLVQSRWQGIELDALVRSQLAHFSDLIGPRITIAGPPVRVSASAAQTIGMALHELATNAGKYGALSTAAGRVSIAWRLDDDAGPGLFSMSWTEREGPPVNRPSRRGFGTTVIESMPRLSLNATVSLCYDPEGLSWTCTCATSSLLEGPLDDTTDA